ncbi:L-allo-threonine aldolase-like isoform X2 [Macrosteles quadrilineatus]|uniref:L-allo-threonine aldolase-like isoform X1 n=1 Tax=Macrosteles quadrilineatus TaxID=74068 RepID=UPI0023E2422B|nr:L-allo-threonine aldolase-like isoform X1 [Macrosteles quadrilineatus]XP_054257693.1 L-allo-threonine aldolase-like isoform X2 [Macrosteles quadrilineatus]
MFVIRSRRFGIANIKLVSLLEAAGHQERLIGKPKFTTMYQTAQIEHSLENVRVVDFRSDTVSKPTDAMRRAMYNAEVGDDVMGEDTTVNALEALAANIFNKEASIFLTSGTMGNLIALMAHCDRRGCEVVVGDKSHMLLWEQSGAAQVAGVQMTAVANQPDGTWSLEEMMSKLRDGSNIHTTQTALICVENTHNWCGGRALPLPWLQRLAKISHDTKIPLHMDGARVFNAALSSEVSVAELCKDFSSVSVCLSKGLGAPIGSMLVGDKAFIDKARRLRKVLGGGWRQAGVVAAAGMYALEHMVQRLPVDHQRAKKIAQAIVSTGTRLISLDLDRVQSNMVFMNFNTPLLTASDFCHRLYKVTKEELDFFGEENPCVIKLFTISATEVRMVLCCNITDDDVTAAINKLQFVIREFDSKEDTLT